jgi:hypothetical protein
VQALVEAGGPDEAPEISRPIAFPQLLRCCRRRFSGWSATVTTESGAMWMDVYNAVTTTGNATCKEAAARQLGSPGS